MGMFKLFNNCPICLEDDCEHTDNEIDAWRKARDKEERVNPRESSPRFIGPRQKIPPYMCIIHPNVAKELRAMMRDGRVPCDKFFIVESEKFDA